MNLKEVRRAIARFDESLETNFVKVEKKNGEIKFVVRKEKEPVIVNNIKMK